MKSLLSLILLLALLAPGCGNRSLSPRALPDPPTLPRLNALPATASDVAQTPMVNENLIVD